MYRRNSLRNVDIGVADPTLTTTNDVTTTITLTSTPDTETEPLLHVKEEPFASEDLPNDEKDLIDSPNFTKVSEEDDADEDEDPPPKKQKQLSSFPTNDETPSQPPIERMESTTTTTTVVKKSKKKNHNNIWTKPTSRRGKKKGKNNHNINNHNAAQPEDTVLITPVQRFPDKTDDCPDATICLSRLYKAEKVELSDDRLTAGSTKGYRMVRATRGVMEGAWYFEIKVVQLGETGHTRLGWSNEKGDLQAPVGYDGNSFGYRDVDGSKVHRAVRKRYGEDGYVEGDVIGFYISLPEGSLYAPKPPHFVWYKGQRYVCAPDGKEDPAKVVPGFLLYLVIKKVMHKEAITRILNGFWGISVEVREGYSLKDNPYSLSTFNSSS